MELTREILKGCLPKVSKDNIEKFYEPLKKWMYKFKIDTPLRIAHFLSQVAVESGDFRYTHELGNSEYFKKYDTGKLAKALGNTPEADGDGALYKGRGLIQITGKANYTAFSKWYFGKGEYELEFVKHPEKLEEPTPAVASAVWYWNNRGLNQIADKDDIKTITKKINGGLNGFDLRRAKLIVAKNYLGI